MVRNFFKIVCLLILLGLPFNLKAQLQVEEGLQDASSLRPTSPQTGDFMKYENTPVNLFTGEASIQIPIYTYEDRDFTIPLFLGYNSCGFIPDKREGIVGLNWYLNAGGVITRRVNGFPDDKAGNPNNIPTSLHGLYYGVKNNIIKTTSKANIYNFQTGSVTVTEYWNIGGCEVDPDQFTVNAPGISGVFFIENNGAVHFVGDKNYTVDLSNFGIQFSSGRDINESEIIITNDQGYKYYFGGTIQHLEISYPFDNVTTPDSDYGPTIIGWHLTRIEAPNGRKAIYSYRTFNEGIPDKYPSDSEHYLMSIHDVDFMYYYSDCSNFGSGFCSYGSGSAGSTVYEVTKTTYLNKITIDQNIIEFSYQQRDNKFYQGLSITSNYDQKTLQINKIFVKHNSNIIKSYTLGYTYMGGTYSRYFLTSLQEDGAPTYTFSYYINQSGLPAPTTHGIDYWGFWNGNNAGGPLIPSSSYNEDGDIIYSGAEREPNESLCDVTLLEQINYPTGGYTHFDYEGHRYSQRLERRIDNNYLPDLYTTGNLLAGGARIKEIKDNDGKGNEVTKNYEYYRNYPNTNQSSGILLDWPRYLYAWKSSCNGQSQITVKKQSQSANQNHNSSENYIHYSEVTEKLSPSNGYLVTKFTSYENNPDVNEHDSLIIDEAFLQCVTNKDLYNNYVGIRMNDCSFQRGYPYEITTYTNNGVRVQKKSTTSFTQLTEYPNNYAVAVMQTGALAISFKLYHAPFLPKTEIDSTFSSLGNTATITNYVYNSRNLLSEKLLTAHSGTFKTVYKYPYNYYQGANLIYTSSASIFKSMVDKNILRTPLEVTQIKDNKIIGSSLNLYKVENNIVVPGEYYSLELATPIATPFPGLSYTSVSSNQVTFNKSTDYKLRAQYLKHDDFGNLTELKRNNNAPVAFLWDSCGTHLMAEVINATYSQISSLNGQSQDYSSLSLYNNIKNLGLTYMNTYCYSPLKGMSGQTDENGVTSYYDYDNLERLENIRNDDQNITSRNYYHYYSETSEDKPTLITDKTSISYTASGGVATLIVTSNCTWSITLSSGASSWLTISPTSGSGNGSVTVTATANSTSARSATITITYSGGLTKTITTSQAAGLSHTLTVSPTSESFDDLGGSVMITVTSNTSWNVTDDVGWITTSPSSGNGNGSFEIMCDTNGGSNSDTRSGTVTVTGGGISKTIRISQTGFIHP